MKTHNFYADLVLSLRTFFDKIVFPNSEIKGYRFNIGNRSLQLNTNNIKFDLPWMMIDYQTSRHVAYHSHTWLKSQFDNTSKYPVLYNRTKNLTLLMQEELFEYQIQVTINCESQLSALQFQHDIERYLVIGKYFQLYSFFSFFTIDDKLLHEDMFDVNNDYIYNLFMQYDPLKDQTIYSFSVKYEPLIRIDSADVSMTNSEQRSFPIVIQLNMINPMPIYTEIPVLERAKPNIKKHFEQLDTYITLDKRYIIASIHAVTEDSKYVFPAIVYDNNFECSIVYNKVDLQTQLVQYEFNGLLTGAIEKTKCVGRFKTDIDNVVYEVDYERLTDVSDSVVTIRLFGPVSGVIVQVKEQSQFGPGYISGWFNGFVDGVPKKFIIEGQLTSDAYTIILGEYRLTINETSESISSYSVVPQPYGNLKYLINEFNSKLLRLNINDTIITEIVFFYNLQLYSFPVNITFDSAGNFKQSFEYTIDGIIVNGCVFGKIHPIKMDITTDYQINNEAFKIVSLKCDFKFDSHVGYGAPFVDKININVTDTTTPVSSAMGSASYFKNEFIEIEDRNNKLLLQNVIISSELFNEYVIPIPDSNDVKIKVYLSDDFDFDDTVLNNKLYWRFYLNLDRMIIDSNSFGIELLERTADDSSNIIYFYCDESIFIEHFQNKIDVDNPIFFQLYKLY